MFQTKSKHAFYVDFFPPKIVSFMR